MGLRKDDPVYYKLRLKKLIKQALEQGVSLQIVHLNDGARVSFVANNGDVAGVDLLEINSQK